MTAPTPDTTLQTIAAALDPANTTKAVLIVRTENAVDSGDPEYNVYWFGTEYEALENDTDAKISTSRTDCSFARVRSVWPQAAI